MQAGIKLGKDQDLGKRTLMEAALTENPEYRDALKKCFTLIEGSVEGMALALWLWAAGTGRHGARSRDDPHLDLLARSASTSGLSQLIWRLTFKSRVERIGLLLPLLTPSLHSVRPTLVRDAAVVLV